MGLDSYFKKLCGPGETAPDPDFGPNPPTLVGGLMSGNGFDGSFRGKVYAPLIEEITGISLYTEMLSPIQVRGIANGLREHLTANPDKLVFDENGWKLTRDQVEDLTKVFETFGELRYCLYGWW
jgi:hypothetical protein